jgi:beta-glucosidase/6-phospho-beta-glucosidase/beta-galactosidase
VPPQDREQVNQKGLDYHRQLVDMLLERQFTPFITFFQRFYLFATRTQA